MRCVCCADAQNEGEPAVVVLFTWLRFMATRQLVWNKNYNVKPREISAAQNALTATMCRCVHAAAVCSHRCHDFSTVLTWLSSGCTATGLTCATSCASPCAPSAAVRKQRFHALIS
jgi:hypothetical protein